MLLLSDKLVSCVAGTNGCLGLRRSNEALALSQGWLEALLPSYRWICWENASSGHNKHQEGIQRILREPAICSYAMYPTLSQELCAMLGQRVRDPLSLLHPSPSGDWLFSHSSNQALSTINELTGRSGCFSCLCPVSAKSITSQLVTNGAHMTESCESTRLINKELSDLWKSCHNSIH